MRDDVLRGAHPAHLGLESEGRLFDVRFVLAHLQRGQLFVAPGDEAYEGLVVGECAREQDLDVNIVREKKAR